MTDLPSIQDVPVANKTVLVRADLNVPMKDGRVTDRTRLERFSGTVRDLADRGARVVVMSHFGRPQGPDAEFSLAAVANELGALLARPITFVPDCVGEPALSQIASLPGSGIAVLENLRFHPEEEKNDRNFARLLAALADIYVNDAFSCAHRAHASTHAITEFLPSFAGPSLLDEVSALSAALESPKRPVGALVGGAKISSKISILNALLEKVDVLIIVGGMANTFLRAQGFDMGRSLCEPAEVPSALGILSKAKAMGRKIVLPVDGIAAAGFAAHAPHSHVSNSAIPPDCMVLDAGPESIDIIKGEIDQLATLLWNGPAGAFEMPPFDKGTNEVARHAAARTAAGKLLSVAGGGDTVAALNHAGVGGQFTYLSTAGGAFLEWLEGKDLPGISALRAKQNSKGEM